MNQTPILFDDVHFSFFVVLADAVQSLLELRFFGRFSGQKTKKGHYILYLFLSLTISAIEIRLSLAPFSLLFLLIRILLLWGIGSALLTCQPAISLLSAIVAKTIPMLSAGITASITFLAISSAAKFAFGKTSSVGFMLEFLGPLFTFALIIAAYQIILRKFKWQGALPNQYMAVFFLPVFMLLIVEQYVFNQVYGNEVMIENATIMKPFADNWSILIIQLFACFSLFSTLYACRRLTEDFSNRIRLLLLERETAAQRDYVEETRARCEQTRSFRHDIKHHLLALYGLLAQGETQKAKAYVQKLEIISENLSFPCKTGNTVVDTVLGSKLSLARQHGIEVECTVKIPSPCTVDDLDLCVLFANAVDNAIHACNNQTDGMRFIRISGKQKGDFFMVALENSCLPDGPYKKGIGLANIEAVCEKYHGAVTTEKQGNWFRLHALLVISRHLDDISVKLH